MRLAVTTETGAFFTFEVDRDCELAHLQALIENETGIANANQALFFNGAPIPPTTKALFDVGIRDNDMILRRAEEDPYDIEVQRRLEEEIRQANVNNNMEQAMEYAPETFGRVFMLYINCEVNGHKVKAFVDSGAQMTIMSSSFADKCGLSWFLDTRFTGVAKGVGSAKILGRVHMSPMKIGSLHLPCSFTVLEEQSVDLLLGLDMLRRHQAVIDLEKNVLRIGGVETPFLGEADLPESARERPEEIAEAEHLANSAAKRARDQSQAAPSSPAASAAPAPAAPGPVPSPRRVLGSAASSARPVAATTALPAATAPEAAGFPESSVEALMALGVTREQAIAALRAANGNADLAAGLLF